MLARSSKSRDKRQAMATSRAFRCLSLPALCALLPLVVFGPKTAAAEEPAVIPAPQAAVSDVPLPPDETRTTVLIWGTGLTAIFYGGSLGASYLWEQDPGASDLRIPVVGPWMKVGRTQLCSGLPEPDAGCSDFAQVFGAVAAGFAGIGQVGGLALLAEGIFMKTAGSRPSAPSSVALSHPGAASRDEDVAPWIYQNGDLTMTAVPLSDGYSTVGAALVGSF